MMLSSMAALLRGLRIEVVSRPASLRDLSCALANCPCPMRQGQPQEEESPCALLSNASRQENGREFRRQPEAPTSYRAGPRFFLSARMTLKLYTASPLVPASFSGPSTPQPPRDLPSLPPTYHNTGYPRRDHRRLSGGGIAEAPAQAAAIRSSACRASPATSVPTAISAARS